MRIISGKNKGRHINAPKNLPVRPTTDMAKEGLFNILNNQYYFEDLEVLDLFSGTGNIAYEFASRGTQRITSVDADPRCVQFIQKTSGELDFGIHALRSEVFAYLERCPATYDLIFADPPYDMPLTDLAKIQGLVFEKGLLKEGGKLIIEHSKQLDLGLLPHFDAMRKYGGNVFSFFSG